MAEEQKVGVAGCQVNLDEGKSSVEGTWVDDIRNGCTELTITFEVKDKCWFSDDSQCYFTFRGVDWVPCSAKEHITQNGTFHYNILAYPRYYFDFIETASKNTRSLVNSLGMQVTDEFENLDIICPIKNRYAIQLINEYRRQFFQKAFKNRNMSDAVLLYMCGEKLLCISFGTWMNKQSLSLETTAFQSVTSPVNFYNDQIYNELMCDRRVSYFRGEDFLQRMFGPVFEIHGTSGYIFLGRYTKKFDCSDGGTFDSNETYMCIRCEENIGKMDGFSSTFSEMKYVK